MINLTKNTRIELIRELQVERGNTFVITYVTSTRNGFEVQMAMDAVRHFYDHLLSVTSDKRKIIDLFMHSNGGDGIVPWRLVNLIREHCEGFNILVPNNAFSAATLTALGADNIVMHPMGALGPTDPIVGNHFNPKDPDTHNILGISVEDVNAYLELIREDVGITHEDELVLAFNHLADKVHPLALGNTRRSRSQSKHLATKLLQLHFDPKKDSQKIDEIVERLTSKSYYHGHPINRSEAKDLGLEVERPSKQLEETMWKLYLDYENEMLMNKKFNFVQEFIAAFPSIGINQVQAITLPKMKGVYIESEHITDVYVAENQLIGVKKPDGLYEVNMGTMKDGWERE